MFEILYQDNHTLIVQTHAGVFDKWGDDVYGQFNVALHVGDDRQRVLNNRALLLKHLNNLTQNNIQRIHWLNQVHGDKVADTRQGHFMPMDADALISDECGAALSIMTADCVPIALFGGKPDEPDNHTTSHQPQIACIHAGWQGLTKGIIKKVVQKFHHKDIKALIGACISQKNYEIDKTLAHTIITNVIEQALVGLTFDELYQAIIVDKSEDKCLIDIVKLTKLQLAHLNVRVLNDDAPNDDVPCSYDVPNLYSYRQQTHANKKATGRMAMVVVQF